MRISVATSAQAAFSWRYLDKIEVKNNAKISKDVKSQAYENVNFWMLFSFKVQFSF